MFKSFIHLDLKRVVNRAVGTFYRQLVGSPTNRLAPTLRFYSSSIGSDWFNKQEPAGGEKQDGEGQAHKPYGDAQSKTDAEEAEEEVYETDNDGMNKEGTGPSPTTLRHYATLNLQWPQDASAVKKQYATMCLEHHPDVNADGDDQKFRDIKDAYTWIIEHRAFVGLGTSASGEYKAKPWTGMRVPIREIRETNHRLRTAVREKSFKDFERAWYIALATDLSFDFSSLMIALEGMEIFHAYGDEHLHACFTMMGEWESNLANLATVEAYDRMLLSYAEFCKTPHVVMTSVEKIVEKMDEKGVVRTEWTNHLIHRCMHMCIWTGTDYDVSHEPKW